MNGALRIREAVAADLAAVLALYEDSGLDQSGANDIDAAPALLARVRAAGGTLLVAERGGTVVGTLTLFVLPLLAHAGKPSAILEDLAVDPAAQGAGVGSALVACALQRAGQAGCYKLALSSNARREGAHAFYDQLGFQRHGISFSVPVPTHAGAMA